MWFYDLSQGFGIVVDFVKQPMHSSNMIKIEGSLTTWYWNIASGLAALVRQRLSFVVVYLFPDSCWKLSENWIKFNSVFSASINICVRKSIECNTSFMLLPLLLSMSLTLLCSVCKTRTCYSTFFYSYCALLIVSKMLLIFSITF